MSIYNVDYNITSVELTPIEKRLDNVEDILFSFAKPLMDLNVIFTYMREGTGAGNYSGATTYLFGDLVNYQSIVYYRNDITTGYTSGIAPNNTTYFIKVLDFTIGLNERIRFSPNKLILEYALNAIFSTSFNQPPVLSDIYIVRNLNDSDCLNVGETDLESSTISQMDIDAEWSLPQTEPTGAIQYDYTVFVPVAVWTALAATGTERDNIILSVLNKYKLLGFLADVQTY